MFNLTTGKRSVSRHLAEEILSQRGKKVVEVRFIFLKNVFKQKNKEARKK